MKKMLGLLLAICFMAFAGACTSDFGGSDSTGGNSDSSSSSSSSSNPEETPGPEDSGEETNNPFAGGLVNGGTYEGN